MNALPTIEWSIRDTPGKDDRARPSIDADAFAGRSVLVATREPAAAAAALIELDGIARRLIICTPELGEDARAAIARRGGVDAVIDDAPTAAPSPIGDRRAPRSTEWVLLTSGTSGTPKLVVHTFATLTAAIRLSQPAPPAPPALPVAKVWGTFYDIRRYGGLQIFLRALLAAIPLVVRGSDESIGDYLVRLADRGATHVSGTPSHWRRALMSPQARTIAPEYVRLSGEIADQGILSALRAFYPGARIAHAFASTEAGVGFEVNDGLEGFPASVLGAHGDVTVAVVDGSLRIRSPRTALRYLDDDTPIADENGWVDTGDAVERRGNRYYFLGRRSGLINVGGLKVYPEEVEAAINRHPAVRASLVRSTRSSITGSLVAADVVLASAPDDPLAAAERRGEILRLCRDSLSPHKVPATIRFVPSLDVAATGKVARRA